MSVRKEFRLDEKDIERFEIIKIGMDLEQMHRF